MHLYNIARMARTFYVCVLAAVLWMGAAGFSLASTSLPGREQKAVARVLRMYPNPAVSLVNFEFSAEVDRTHNIQIYSFMGRKMTELTIEGPRLQLTIDDHYLRGIYIYHLRNKDGKVLETGKFQVVR